LTAIFNDPLKSSYYLFYHRTLEYEFTAAYTSYLSFQAPSKEKATTNWVAMILFEY